MYLGYPYIESVHGAVKCSWGIHTRKACTELQTLVGVSIQGKSAQSGEM